MLVYEDKEGNPLRFPTPKDLIEGIKSGREKEETERMKDFIMRLRSLEGDKEEIMSCLRHTLRSMKETEAEKKLAVKKGRAGDDVEYHLNALDIIIKTLKKRIKLEEKNNG